MLKHITCLILSVAILWISGCASAKKAPTRRTFGESVDDSVIVSRIKAKLVKDPIVHALRINVHSFLGDVTLRGSVYQKYEADRAIKLAKQVRGVKSVKSELAITPLY